MAFYCKRVRRFQTTTRKPPPLYEFIREIDFALVIY